MSNNAPTTDHQAILDAERAVNEQYIEEIERIIKGQPDLIKQISVMQSQQWTTSDLPRPGIDRGATSAVIGRVALEDGHPYSDVMGRTFYVAGWRVEKDGFETVNWAAPVASLFFEGKSAQFEIASSVLGRRTFVLRLDDLVDFQDELEAPGRSPFELSVPTLDIPTAPSRRMRSSEPARGVATETSGDDAPTEPELVDRDPAPAPAPAVEADTPGPIRLERAGELRAAEAVAKVMDMPKQGRMGVVLPTMQPDQYRLVSAPGPQPMIVQGQPGTGKTVIAAHRAVYLTSEEREGERVARIAIVGPSDHYVEHVTPLISELKEPAAEIRVLSLPALLKSIAGLRSQPKPGEIGRIESSWEIGRTIDDFVRAMPERPRSGRIDLRVRRVIEAMAAADASVIRDSETREWLRGLPDWSDLSEQMRYLPMLATVALALNPRAAGDWVGHLIVDEAQDIRPLEWRILTGSLLEAGGGMSLFGDTNQRRSDFTAPSWNQVAEDLELTDEDGQCEVHELENGYRSTRQILRFANQLLPRGERGEQALREGPSPKITQVSSDRRTKAAVDEAIDLAARHSGMVAVISVEPRQPTVEFRKRNWVRGRFQHSWTLNGSTVVVLHPDEARGLEFDGAVVVEPGDFPENVGRQGVLYTSLTRANKELTVVHAQSLPRGLRPPR